MLTEEQMVEIREHLEKAQNPLFFFDNDNDGLTSFLQLQRFIGRGKGIAIKSFPDLNITYYRRVQELKPDYVFILDKPVVSKDFLDKVKEDNIPIVWIDHHQAEKPEDDYVNYYNPFLNDGSNEPVSYLVYRITNNKKDIWLSMIGCVSDCYMPDFYPEFEKEFPELGMKNAKSPFDLLYKSEIGKMSRVLDFSLKDTTTNVVQMLKFMMKVKGPMDILDEGSGAKQMLLRFNEINSKYQELMIKARSEVKGKLLYFQYGGTLSLSSNLANQLSYEFPDNIIVVAYLTSDIANLSLRGKEDILSLTLDAIDGIGGASGGGHKNATGAKVLISDLPKFKENVDKLVGAL